MCNAIAWDLKSNFPHYKEQDTQACHISFLDDMLLTHYFLLILTTCSSQLHPCKILTKCSYSLHETYSTSAHNRHLRKTHTHKNKQVLQYSIDKPGVRGADACCAERGESSRCASPHLDSTTSGKTFPAALQAAACQYLNTCQPSCSKPRAIFTLIHFIQHPCS